MHRLELHACPLHPRLICVTSSVKEVTDMKTVKSLVLILFALTAAACAPRYLPLASHTVAAGENQEADVVWITEEQLQVKRCANTPQGPVCITAQQR